MLPIFVFAKVSEGSLSDSNLELAINTASEARPVNAIEKTNTISHWRDDRSSRVFLLAARTTMIFFSEVKSHNKDGGTSSTPPLVFGRGGRVICVRHVFARSIEA